MFGITEIPAEPRKVVLFDTLEQACFSFHNSNSIKQTARVYTEDMNGNRLRTREKVKGNLYLWDMYYLDLTFDDDPTLAFRLETPFLQVVIDPDNRFAQTSPDLANFLLYSKLISYRDIIKDLTGKEAKTKLIKYFPRTTTTTEIDLDSLNEKIAATERKISYKPHFSLTEYVLPGDSLRTYSEVTGFANIQPNELLISLQTMRNSK